ncbi:anti-sigma factor [Dinghuibacter silviterrae]|uniref:Uncharacterized protein n=1 Tax=Dinghuibacter silviterrae TaxID=1539049 RepID=A0A4R8DI68_9BACT|nr:hypothetical protein [Dinghuibacter silviterrae]TDW97433.1 hypothetical protein EDB95_5282 [Dinghuibacter silviterrae]
MATYDREYIIRYVDGELPEEESRWFETDLRQDPALQAEVALYRELKESLRQRLAPDASASGLRATLTSLRPQYFRSRIVPFTRWVAGVAAAAVIGIVSVLLWPSSRQDTIDRLSRTEMIGTAERGNNTDTLLQKAAVYFNRQDFSHALPVLDQAVRADTSNQLALFYRGVAAWKTGGTAAARADWQKVYAGESLMRYDAAFYMALSYAAENDRPAALQWLSRIPEGSSLSAKAKELNAKLE